MKSFKLWVACAVCLPAAVAIAQNTSDHETLFRAEEGSLDIFGTASVGQYTLENISGNRVRDDARLGLGIGGNYFFTRNLGIGGDVYSENPNHHFIDNTSGSLIIRFPFDRAHIAPYIFGGGGYQFDPDEEWLGHAGAGLDIRFNRNVGMFVDGRYVFLNDAPDLGVFRLGLRLVF